MKAGSPVRATNIPAVAASRLSGRIVGYGTAHRPQNLQVQAASQRLSRNGRWRSSCGAVARSTMPPWSSARPGGNAGRASVPPTTSRRRNCPTSRRPAPNTPRSMPRSCRMCILRVDRAYPGVLPPRLQGGRDSRAIPRFQGRNRYNSFTYPQYGGGAVLDGGVLSLSKIGRIPLRLHRPLEGTPKTVTISREADGWYACISCAEVPTQPLAADRRRDRHRRGPEGVPRHGGRRDGGEPTPLPDGGEAACQGAAAGESPQEGQQTPPQGRGAARNARTRRCSGSARTFTTRRRSRCCARYDTIYLEDLRVANLVRNHHLAKSISDAGWAQFRTILEGKAACAGRRVIAVPAQYTSQDCSGCGERVPKSLARAHPCLPLLRTGAGPRRERGAQLSNGPGRPFGDSRGYLRGRTEKPLPFRDGEHVTRNVPDARANHARAGALASSIAGWFGAGWHVVGLRREG